MKIPQLQQGKNAQANQQDPRFPTPKLVASSQSQKQQLNPTLRKDEAHAGEDTGKRGIGYCNEQLPPI
jgi:hypothetical protein